jgi:hypothetical protein
MPNSAAAVPRKRGRPRLADDPGQPKTPTRIIPPGMIRTPILIPRTLQCRVSGLAKLKSLSISQVVTEALEKYTSAELIKVIPQLGKAATARQ